MAQHVLRLVNTDQQRYSIYMEEPQPDIQEVIVISIYDRCALCFHIAITHTNTNIENANVVCSQAIIYRSTENDPLLHFAVYDPYTKTLYFCLLDPEQRTFEDVAQFQMPWQEAQVAEKLHACVASNAEALR
jgi:hypothetical protein